MLLFLSRKDQFDGAYLSFLELDSHRSQYDFIVRSSSLEMAVSFTGGRTSRYEGEQMMTEFSFFE